MQIDAEKSPFLVEKLKIWMLPTLACIKQVWLCCTGSHTHM